ncbi:MAG: diaminopimelate epimerase [Firmicutes bacterium]|nr:diaminopimelate epimerase [Bacillota bacterium]
MKKKFIKMHGLGNDYIYFNCLDEEFIDAEHWVKTLSNRNLGIGGDGIVLIKRSKLADAMMVMFNADGSEGAMCGNAIRCVGKLLFDEGIVKNNCMNIETKSGIKSLEIKDNLIKVNMGAPRFCKDDNLLPEKITIEGQDYYIIRVNMGNPHAVVFEDNLDKIDLKKIGPLFEHHDLFKPHRINTEFVKVLSKNHLKMRVWERGSGETKACGTGACAAAIAACQKRLCDMNTDIIVTLDGGDLTINYTLDTVYMSGSAHKVFEGEIDLNEIK